MHPGFNLFPRDSVLLGLALGEFLRLGELGETDTFEEVLYRRVHPFVPDMVREAWTPIADQRLPDGLTWEKVAEGEERSVPDLSHWSLDDADENAKIPKVNPFRVAATYQFGRRGNHMYRIALDDSQRSLLDLLMGYLTADDEKPRTRWNEVNVVLRRWDMVEEPREPVQRPKPPEEIARLIERLVDQNDMRKTFTVGQLLGRAFANCVATEKTWVFMEESFENLEDEYRSVKFEDLSEPSAGVGLEETWNDLVEALGKDPVYRACFFSPDLIRSTKPFWSGRYFGFTRSNEPLDSGLNRELCVRTSLCLIVGGILGYLSDKHREADFREAQKPVPRTLSIPESATREQIGGVLHLTEQALKGELGQYTSEVPVAIMGHLIERLTVELWPLGPKQRVSEVLHDKKRSEALLEQEFARKAIFFYDIYRKPAEHPGGVFRCGAYEGPLFYYAMRALEDLAKRILADREKKRR